MTSSAPTPIDWFVSALRGRREVDVAEVAAHFASEFVDGAGAEGIAGGMSAMAIGLQVVDPITTEDDGVVRIPLSATSGGFAQYHGAVRSGDGKRGAVGLPREGSHTLRILRQARGKSPRGRIPKAAIECQDLPRGTPRREASREGSQELSSRKIPHVAASAGALHRETAAVRTECQVLDGHRTE